MEASMSYQAGKPIISDVEFDELKGKLRKKNSKVVQQVQPGMQTNPCILKYHACNQMLHIVAW